MKPAAPSRGGSAAARQPAMSAPGTLSNYYVDSFLVPEGDELAAPRYAPAPLGPPPRPAALAEHPELAPCSFQPKAPVFGPPWSPAHPAGTSGVPAVYHPYAHHQAPVAPPDGRYMRSWLEPVPGSLSFPGLPTSRHYGIKPEPLAARRADCTTFDTHTLSLSDYACGSPPVDRDKQSHEGAFSESNGESEANGEKPQIDPSKWDDEGNGLQGSAPAAGRCRGAGLITRPSTGRCRRRCASPPGSAICRSQRCLSQARTGSRTALAFQGERKTKAHPTAAT